MNILPYKYYSVTQFPKEILWEWDKFQLSWKWVSNMPLRYKALEFILFLQLTPHLSEEIPDIVQSTLIYERSTLESCDHNKTYWWSFHAYKIYDNKNILVVRCSLSSVASNELYNMVYCIVLCSSVTKSTWNIHLQNDFTNDWSNPFVSRSLLDHWFCLLNLIPVKLRSLKSKVECREEIELRGARKSMV